VVKTPLVAIFLLNQLFICCKISLAKQRSNFSGRRENITKIWNVLINKSRFYPTRKKKYMFIIIIRFIKSRTERDFIKNTFALAAGDIHIKTNLPTIKIKPILLI